MRSLSSVLFLAALPALLLPMPDVRAGDFKLESGFTLLFNGKNLDGWQTRGKKETLEGKTEAFKGRFKVAEGIITFDPAVKGDSYIETTKEFAKDVHIKLDFKAGAKCNNDFLLRGTKFDVIPDKVKGVKEGEWQTLEIIVTGSKIVHKVNGETARTSKANAKASPFVMRAEFGAIQVKNIRVKE